MQTNIIHKVREQFASMVIYKDPASTNSLFAGRNLPSFVKDFILKRYINEDGSVDRAGLTGFLDMVIPQKQTEVKDRLASGEELTLLTRFIIYIDLVKDVRRFGIPDLGIKINEGQIPEYVYKNIKENSWMERNGVLSSFLCFRIMTERSIMWRWLIINLSNLTVA